MGRVSLLYIDLTQDSKSAVILYPRPLQDDFVTERGLHKTAPFLFSSKKVEWIDLSFTLYLKIQILKSSKLLLIEHKLNFVTYNLGFPVGYVNLVDVLRPWPELTLKNHIYKI